MPCSAGLTQHLHAVVVVGDVRQKLINFVSYILPHEEVACHALDGLLQFGRRLVQGRGCLRGVAH